MNRILSSIVSALVFALLLTGPGFAHSNIVSAVPADGSAGPAPAAIEMTFNEEVNLVFSNLTLVGPDGSDVALGALSAIAEGKGMAAPVETTLSPGSYKVVWTLLSPDGHKLEGSYDFAVAP